MLLPWKKVIQTNEEKIGDKRCIEKNSIVVFKSHQEKMLKEGSVNLLLILLIAY